MGDGQAGHSGANPGEISDTAIGWRFTNPNFVAHDRDADDKITLSMGDTAEEVAARLGIGRAECDEFAARSHERALAAIDEGRFETEIVPVPVRTAWCPSTNPPRRGTDVAKLAKLLPVFRAGGIVTAGSSSSLADGAAALLVASAEAVARYGLTPRARIVTTANAGIEPHIMGLGPVPSTQKALARAGWSIGDLRGRRVERGVRRAVHRGAAGVEARWGHRQP